MLSRNWLYCVNKQLNIVPNKVATRQIISKVNVTLLFDELFSKVTGSLSNN